MQALLNEAFPDGEKEEIVASRKRYFQSLKNLGADHTYSLEGVRRKFRALHLQCHPDKIKQRLCREPTEDELIRYGVIQLSWSYVAEYHAAIRRAATRLNLSVKDVEQWSVTMSKQEVERAMNEIKAAYSKAKAGIKRDRSNSTACQLKALSDLDHCKLRLWQHLSEAWREKQPAWWKWILSWWEASSDFQAAGDSVKQIAAGDPVKQIAGDPTYKGD